MTLSANKVGGSECWKAENKDGLDCGAQEQAGADEELFRNQLEFFPRVLTRTLANINCRLSVFETAYLMNGIDPNVAIKNEAMTFNPIYPELSSEKRGSLIGMSAGQQMGLTWRAILRFVEPGSDASVARAMVGLPPHAEVSKNCYKLFLECVFPAGTMLFDVSMDMGDELSRWLQGAKELPNPGVFYDLDDGLEGLLLSKLNPPAPRCPNNIMFLQLARSMASAAEIQLDQWLTLYDRNRRLRGFEQLNFEVCNELLKTKGFTQSKGIKRIRERLQEETHKLLHGWSQSQ